MKAWMVSISFVVPASIPSESWNTNPGLLLKTNSSVMLWTPRWKFLSSDQWEIYVHTPEDGSTWKNYKMTLEVKYTAERNTHPAICRSRNASQNGCFPSVRSTDDQCTKTPNFPL
jgi:hypothetical protein